MTSYRLRYHDTRYYRDTGNSLRNFNVDQKSWVSDWNHHWHHQP